MRSICRISVFLFTVCAWVTQSCQSDRQYVAQHFLEQSAGTDSVAIRRAFSSSPVLSPEESLERIEVEEGFEVQLVAAEPLVNSPVAMTFDNKGRMWVAEMQGYMPDTLGTDEDKPTGKIVILEDKDKDGTIDNRKVFLDSLVLPRALCFVENGILIAEPPNLWFYEIENDQPGRKALVDSTYSEGGNVEHEPNGLVRALDNWIYNAKSSKRYRKVGDKWFAEKTHFRGQWGIAQDDYGRLYYNNNSQNLLGDFFSPGLGAGNPNQRKVAGFNENIVPDNRVYPARPTPGVNRGYLEGILDEQLRLVNFTAACAPVLYRGELFSKDYYLNAFVAEPAANLIKRNILEEDGYQVQGRQAYEGKEFLTSVDERFRPVSLYNGPDGALYVVDMYRGIIQHEFFLTEYLANEIKTRKLDQPISCGRIYRIVPAKKDPNAITIVNNPLLLIKLLKHPNGWVRDKAQQLLVDNKYTQVAPFLRQNLTLRDKPLAVVHSLWTLEGLGELRSADVIPLLQHKDWHIRTQALSVLPSVMSKENYTAFVSELELLLEQKDTLAAPYVAFLVQHIRKFDEMAANRLLQKAVQQYPENIYVSDAMISSLHNKEEGFLKDAVALNTDSSLAISMQLKKVLYDVEDRKKSQKSKSAEQEFPKGYILFKNTCQGCHGADGNGVKSLAPPLNKSNWVVGDKDRLIPIILYGLTGPIKVSGKLYQAPEINGDMPGIGNNNKLTDEEIAQLISFIRNSWNNKAEKVNKEDIAEARSKFKGRQAAFTMEQLDKL